MSLEYPCVYYDNQKCTKDPEPGFENWCVMGPCSHETPSNADRIRRMSEEELAEFLSQLSYSGKEPWSEPFARLFCDQCPEPEYTLNDGRKLNLHECDFKDGKCPHGNDIVWWLNQSAAEAGDC